MLIEAFSQGKKFGQPEANEDSFVAIPGTSAAWLAITPRNTAGSHTAMMQMGYAITVRRKCVRRFAVRQKMQMCGKAIEDSGMNV